MFQTFGEGLNTKRSLEIGLNTGGDRTSLWDVVFTLVTTVLNLKINRTIEMKRQRRRSHAAAGPKYLKFILRTDSEAQAT